MEFESFDNVRVVYNIPHGKPGEPRKTNGTLCQIKISILAHSLIIFGPSGFLPHREGRKLLKLYCQFYEP